MPPYVWTRLGPPGMPGRPLDTPGPAGPPAPPSHFFASLKLLLIAPRFAGCLDLCLFFMPDPRRMRQQGQRSWLRAFMFWTSLPLNPWTRMRLAPLKLVLLTVLDLCLFMPDPRPLDPVSLFLTDERSDAAVVGSGNKAMRESPVLTF